MIQSRSGAALRPLTGRDEEFLLGEGAGMLPAARANALLARCLRGVEADAVLSLRYGEREALLLQLRAVTFGDRMACVLTCPEPDCGARMDVDLSVAALLDRQAPAAAPLEATVHGADGAWTARFRLPTAGDVQEGAAVALRDPEAAVRLVLGRCVTAVLHDGADVATEDVPWPLAAAVDDRMLEADPFAATVLGASCPECGRRFQAPFDPADYLLRELVGRGDALYEEVHAIALRYHWSEADILGLTRRRRRLYLELLAGEG